MGNAFHGGNGVAYGIVKMAANKLTTQQSHRFPTDEGSINVLSTAVAAASAARLEGSALFGWG